MIHFGKQKAPARARRVAKEARGFPKAAGQFWFSCTMIRRIPKAKGGKSRMQFCTAYGIIIF
jgi:hypothetical protein